MLSSITSGVVQQLIFAFRRFSFFPSNFDTTNFVNANHFFMKRLKFSEMSKDNRTSETSSKKLPQKVERRYGLMLFKTKNGQIFRVSENFGFLKLLQSSEYCSFIETQTKNLALTISICSPYRSTSPKTWYFLISLFRSTFLPDCQLELSHQGLSRQF